MAKLTVYECTDPDGGNPRYYRLDEAGVKRHKEAGWKLKKLATADKFVHPKDPHSKVPKKAEKKADE